MINSILSKYLMFFLTVILVFLPGCKDQSHFPGFKEVTITGQKTGYLFDQRTIKKEAELVSFNMIKILKDGHAIQMAVTDCHDKISFQNGTFYPDNKNAESAVYPGSEAPFSIHSDKNMKQLVQDVCAAYLAGLHHKDKGKQSSLTGIPVLADQVLPGQKNENNLEAVQHIASADVPAPSSCGEPFPCNLDAIIDRADWEQVQSALAFATKMNIEEKVNWTGKSHGHKGYIIANGDDKVADQCKGFNVISFVGHNKETRSVTTCQQADGTIEIK